jgi:hypothetical protein
LKAKELAPLAALGWLATGCVADVGDLGNVEEPPDGPVGPLFAPRDAGPVAPEPASVPTVAPVATPIAPVAPSPGIPELAGRGSLTLLHGVVDAEVLFFCVVIESDEGSLLSVEPMPAGGLAFGQALVLPMEGIIDPELAEVRTVALAAQPGDLDDDCAELLPRFGHSLAEGVRAVELPHHAPVARSVDAGVASQPPDAGALFDAAALLSEAAPVLDGGGADAGVDAGPQAASDAGAAVSGSIDSGAVDFPPVRTGELPRLLPGTFEDRSYLLVASGCLGAPGLADENEQAVCGPGFSRDRSSFSGIFVGLSRLVDFGAMGMQFVHASEGFGELTLRSDPAETEGTFFTIASAVVLGEIAPYSARRSLSVLDLGEPLDEVLLELSSNPSGATLGIQPWPAALAPNGVVLENGGAYSVVLIGPGVGAGEGAWWNAPMLTVVDNDPTDQ